MHRALINLVTLLLLVTQGWMLVAPGKMLCLPIGVCTEHEGIRGSAPDGQGCRGASACDESEELSAVGRCGDHEHGPTDPASHQHDPCGCHLHVPPPVHLPMPGPSQPQDDTTGMRPVALTAPGAAADLDRRHAGVRGVGGYSPEFVVRDQVLALRAIRIMV